MSSTLGKVLIIDDEVSIVEFLDYNLKKAGFNTETAHDGTIGIHKAKSFKPDLILLDVMMPGKNGFDTLKALRSNSLFQNTIVIFLTALADEKSEIEGLKLGADDYIYKPIKPELVVQRVHTALRRKPNENHNLESNSILSFDQLEINKNTFLVLHQNAEIVLAKKEFELLYLLASKPGRVFLRNEILDQVWGSDIIVGDRTIDVHIRKIRQKMNIDLIKTVKGVGYKFEYN